MRVAIIICALCAVALAGNTPPPPAVSVSVTYESGKFSFVEDIAKENAAAWGTWQPGEMYDGWARLSVSSNGSQADTVQGFAAGYLEGTVSQSLIWDTFRNVMSFYFPGKTEMPGDIVNWFTEQMAWTRAQVAANPNDDFWQMQGFLVAQFDGLVAGYASVAPSDQTLTWQDMQMLSSTGDMLNLVNAVKNETDRPDISKMTKEEFDAYTYKHALCTGLIKVSPELDNIFAAHSAWFTFSNMVRIAKSYNFPMHLQHEAQRTTFSSYPGFLNSLDDFYINSRAGDQDMAGLIMVQTTNNIYNMSLLNAVNTSSLLSWQSVRAANVLASTGPEWFALDAHLNSGLYSNMYMIVDLKLFTPGKPLLPNTLWVMDQIPGLTQGTDMTEVLAYGYFGSYNVPWHKEVWTLSGYGTALNQTGNEGLTYELAPRAKIMRRDANEKVLDMDGLKKFMRYNDYLNDPIAEGNPMNAICSRGDLLKENPAPMGCYDSKVTDLHHALDGMRWDGINGPTRDGVPTFSWTPWESVAHFGQPNVFDFDFTKMDFADPTPLVS